MRITKRGVAVLLAVTLAGGYGAAEGLKTIDNATQHTVDSVTETMPNGGNYITLAKQAVIDLGLAPDQFNATRIGQEVKGNTIPQPGQQVTFNEVQHWYGETTVDGSTPATNNK